MTRIRAERATHVGVALLLSALLACAASTPSSFPSQAPRTTSVSSYSAAPESSGRPATTDELATLVAPIAFYADPLLALVLPAATQPLQIVQAARFLDAHARNSSLQPDPKWDPSVKSLLNYPAVVQKLNDDLAWTERLGDAVYDQQQDVIEAIQAVRVKAYAAGTLRSDSRQKVTLLDGVVTIEPADSQVIYVPVYDPQVIYVSSPAPPVIVYSDPYPVYWGTAAVFASGVALGWALDWYHDDIWYGPGGWYGWHGGDVDINRATNIDRSVNIDRPAAPGRPERPPGGGSWRPDNRPGGPLQRPSTLPAQRPGTGDATRPAQLPSTRPTQLPSTRPTQLPATRPGDRPSTGLDSGRFGTYQRGSDVTRDSSRGAASRAGSYGGAGAGSPGGSRPSMSHPPTSSRGSYGGGGGSRAGGGMSRGGGGARGGGGRR